MKSQLSVLGLVFAASLSFQEIRHVSRVDTITPEQREILSHLELVYLRDGQGATTKTLRVTGLNLQLVNGLGATNGNPTNHRATAPGDTATNGLGNLIIGYAEEPFQKNERTGSHNLVIGAEHRYTGFAGVVAGRANASMAPFAAVVGGQGNLASGEGATVLGGGSNRAIGRWSTVTAGVSNFAPGEASSVSGGWSNNAGGDFSSVTGGFQNFAEASSSTVTGGRLNLASGEHASVTGGESNIALSDRSAVSGGREVVTQTEGSWAAGGLLEE